MGELVEKLADAESELDSKKAEVNQLQTNIKHLTEASEVRAGEFEQIQKDFEKTKSKLHKLQKVANENAEKLCGREQEVKSVQQQVDDRTEEETNKSLEIANLQSKIAGTLIILFYPA